MENYIDIIMQNHVAVSDSSADSEVQYRKIKYYQKITNKTQEGGGKPKIKKVIKLANKKYKSNKKSKDVFINDGNVGFLNQFRRQTDEDIKSMPTGGFPPLFICKKGEKQIDEDKTRGFATKKTAVTMKEIMEKRRDNTPFVTL